MDKKDYFLTNDESYNLYKMLYEIIRILEVNGVEYWVCGGTFLGAIRSGGIIKWDDDLDIELPVKYLSKMEKIFDNNKVYGMKKSGLCFKIYYRDGRNIDVFFMEKRGNNWELSFPDARRLWPKEYFLDGELYLYPLREYKFGAYNLKG